RASHSPLPKAWRSGSASLRTEGERDPQSLSIEGITLVGPAGELRCTDAMMRMWLAHHPTLRALYEAKERLAGFYRIRSFVQASRVLTAITDALARSSIPELVTFRETLVRWRKEIVAFFRGRATNGMTEGFNGKAKLVKRRAYGYKSFTNYRL